MRRIRTLLAAFAAAGLALALLPAAGPASALSGSLQFSPPIQLPRWSGGEPSLAYDPTGNGSVYVTAPQFIPAALNGTPAGSSAAGDKGVGVWASHDGGATFPINGNVGSGAGGGDSDVDVTADHTVYVADLEAVAAAICSSTDGGKSFSSGGLVSDGCSTITTNQQGPENDREWLTHDSKGNLYLTYHDFAAGFPINLRSTDKGKTFLPCGSILDPAGPAGQNYQPTNGTLVAKPAIGKDNSIYVEVTEPDQVAPPVGAALNHLFIAVAKGGCDTVSTFTNHLIYTDPGADLGKIFNAVAIDGGGTLYVVAAGHTKAGQDTTNVWLFTSKDGGATWSAPKQVNTPDLKANVMPAVVGGLGSNQLAIGWFGTTTAGDPNGLKNQWRYYAATSFDGGQSFSQATVTPDIIHYGDICTMGLFCGLVPGPSNRNLADFSSIAVDPVTGCVGIALPGDPYNRPDVDPNKNNFTSSAYFSRQVGGPCLAAPAAATPATPVAASTPSASGTAEQSRGGTLAATGEAAGVAAIGLVLVLLALGLRRARAR